MKNNNRILVVDDDEVLSELLEILLKLHNFESFTATNGAEAITQVQKNDFGLIILDLMMPTMDGVRFLKKLRNELKMTMPVIVLSGMNKVEIIDEALEAGATKVIFKPVEAEEIIKHIRVYTEK